MLVLQIERACRYLCLDGCQYSEVESIRLASEVLELEVLEEDVLEVLVLVTAG